MPNQPQPNQPTERVVFESANGKVIFNGDLHRVVKRNPYDMTTVSDSMLIADLAREIERLRAELLEARSEIWLLKNTPPTAELLKHVGTGQPPGLADEPDDREPNPGGDGGRTST